MARRSCDGPGLLAAFRAGVANLEAHVDEINALNVYPVPDGDTGSNMFATVRAALEEADTVAGAPADRVAQAISFGALMGARGNSGVITSQIFRGMAEGLAGKKRFNGLDLAHALAQGTKAAYGAVAKPVEGTILTVIREASDAAVATAERENDLEGVLAATVDAAERSVARTPTLLAILREAGVVDSGGQGILRLFEGALAHLRGRAPATAAARTADVQARPVAAFAGEDHEGFGYETMFLLRAEGSGGLDVDAIREHLESIGESVLVAGDARAVKVHVHNERPDQVIAYGLGLGNLSRITVENLDNQAQDVRETRAAAFTGAAEGAAMQPAADGSDNGAGPDGGGHSMPLAVIAVAPGDGLEAIFRDLGVAAVVRGGQTANPSTGELMQAVSSIDAREVLLLPNNPNVIMAARQVASMADRPVTVVPTRNAAEGFAALLALDASKGADENAPGMTAAGRAVQTLAVTEAVRDATIGGRKVRRGQTIVLDPDDGLLACDNDRSKAVMAGIAAVEAGFELITVYYGDGADLAEAEALAQLLGRAHEGVEVEVVHGGQPHYRYLIAAE
ncbi:MAG TPA: DAK2 domain-containing protein [Vitreimonas sp.]|nr:DAK2 domain-containing protein [Vitreimonas sp.]